MGKYEGFFIRLLFAVFLAFLGSGITSMNIFYITFSWWTFHLSSFVFSLFHEVIAVAPVFVVDGQIIELIPACVAASAYLLLALLILLTRGISLKKGLMMFFWGSVLILVANVIRMEILVSLLLNNNINYFASLHLLLWKIVSSVYVAAVWIFLCWTFHVKNIPVYSDVQSFLHVKRK